MGIENNRFRAKLLISLLPGVHLRELQRLLRISFNSTRYHVDHLASTGDILRVEERGFSRLYPRGTGEAERALLSQVRRPTNRRILACLIKTRRLTHQQLCEFTGLAKSTVSKHLAILVQVGAVKPNLVGEDRLKYELSDPATVERLLTQNPRSLEKAVSRFLDTWDF